ncbi:LPD1 domain-containing protein [Viridibacillus arvi]|uniref:LPD1 domain-containing protein n=1 Tax=Viridibacillus arvi TaxID=263475 RepID=UPI0034CE29FF
MANQKERIETLRKEKLKESFQQSGISAKFIDDFTIRLSKDITEYNFDDLKLKITDSIKKQMSKRIETFKDYEQLESLAKEISFGSNKISIKSLELVKDDSGLQEYLIELLATFGKERSKKEYIFENYKHLLPLQIELKQIILNAGQYEELTAYSLGTKKFTKRNHDAKWYLTKHKNTRKPERILDIATAFTDIFLMNSVEQFTLKNKELYIYKKAEQLYLMHEEKYLKDNEMLVPQEPLSRSILINALKKYDIVSNEVTFVNNETLDQFGKECLFEIDEETNSITNFSIAVFNIMLKEFVKQTNYIKEKVERAVKETSEYALSFQTKKHINKKTKEIMGNNKFLQKYGYVELDNDVELEKFHVLEKEFVELKKKIYIPDCKDHSFRIKKLGKHRAAGLYYSAPVRATIFDLDYPDAYCHELGHQIDHVLSKGIMQSETVRFMRVAEKYKEAVGETINALPEDHFFKLSWKGKSKFNSSYYFLPTEIFARSFELYLFHKGIETSFLKKEYDTPVYPSNKEYLRLVERYFDDLFSLYKIEDIKDVEENKEIKEINSPIPKMPVAQPTISILDSTIEEAKKYEQLSLF